MGVFNLRKYENKSYGAYLVNFTHFSFCSDWDPEGIETDYVEVNSHRKLFDPNKYPGGGCYSQGLGRKGTGKQVINLGPGGCKRGTIIHEFIHAWGFWHEHTRPDRG